MTDATGTVGADQALGHKVSLLIDRNDGSHHVGLGGHVSPSLSPSANSSGSATTGDNVDDSGAARFISPTKSDSTRRIVASITQAIVQRRLMPGTKLAEQKLADIYGVSRTLVRQALNQLPRDHLVTLTPARGAHVATPSAEEARQVFEVRNLLETALVGQLSCHITNQQIDTLKAHLLLEQSAIERQDIAERTRLLGEFHTLLAQQHGNAILTELLIDLLNRSSLIALMYQSSPSAERSHLEHVQLVTALEKHDTALVQQLMSQHLHNVERHLRFDPRETDLAAVLGRVVQVHPSNNVSPPAKLHQTGQLT